MTTTLTKVDGVYKVLCPKCLAAVAPETNHVSKYITDNLSSNYLLNRFLTMKWMRHYHVKYHC